MILHGYPHLKLRRLLRRRIPRQSAEQIRQLSASAKTMGGPNGRTNLNQLPIIQTCSLVKAEIAYFQLANTLGADEAPNVPAKCRWVRCHSHETPQW